MRPYGLPRAAFPGCVGDTQVAGDHHPLDSRGCIPSLQPLDLTLAPNALFAPSAAFIMPPKFDPSSVQYGECAGWNLHRPLLPPARALQNLPVALHRVNLLQPHGAAGEGASEGLDLQQPSSPLACAVCRVGRRLELVSSAQNPGGGVVQPSQPPALGRPRLAALAWPPWPGSIGRVAGWLADWWVDRPSSVAPCRPLTRRPVTASCLYFAVD